MKNRLLPLLVPLLFGICHQPAAQSNALIDRIVLVPELTVEDATLLVLRGERRFDTVPDEQAVVVARERGWIAEDREPGYAITLGEFALLTARVFEIPGGFMYGLFGSPRYAARELSFREMIPGSQSPYRTLSGEEALEILSAVLDWKEARS